MNGSSKLTSQLALAGGALIAAIALGRPELVALATPLLLHLAVALARGRTGVVSVDLELDRDRALEGQEVAARLSVRSAERVDWLEVRLRLPPGLGADEHSTARVLALEPGEKRELPVALHCRRWGAHRIDGILTRRRESDGLTERQEELDAGAVVRVYPRPETVHSLLVGARTQARAGSQLSRARGEGIELAELRPFAPGDQLRRINWRATARRGSPWVTERNPERNVDVVLFLDTYAEARSPAGGTLDLALRAAAAIAAQHLARRDRVGLVGFGGVLQWLTPGLGATQIYRISDALIESELVFSYVAREVDVIPRRVLPPQALVIALTPLIDERSVAALLDLRGRGYDLAIVDTSPEPFAPRPRTDIDRLAHRVWALKRTAVRGRFARAGVAVGTWEAGRSLEHPLWEVNSFRRHTRQPVSA